MPIYEFACNVCKNNFEQLLPISRMDDNANCPDCGREVARRTVHEIVDDVMW